MACASRLRVEVRVGVSLLVRLLNAVAFLPQAVVLLVLVLREVVQEVPVLFPVLVVPLPVDVRTVNTRACVC